MDSNNSYFSDDLEDQAIIQQSGEGEKLGSGGVSTTFKIKSSDTNDRIGVYEATIAPGEVGAKLHYHRYMDETFIILDGILTLQLLGREMKIKKGGLAYAPRFTPHGFYNNTDTPVTFMLVFNPAHKREEFIEGLYDILDEEPVDPEKFLKLFHKYDSYPVDEAEMLPSKDKNG